MIDISSLPDYTDITNGFVGKIVYKVISSEWTDFSYDGYNVAGIFLDHDSAREFVVGMVNNILNWIKSENYAYDDSSIDIFWDEDSNCDDGVSIIVTDRDEKEHCWDYAIEMAPLWYKS